MVWIQERMDPKEWKVYLARLMTPPPEAVVSAGVDEAEGQQFMAFMAAVTGG